MITTKHEAGENGSFTETTTSLASSVELGLNSKKETVWTIKQYGSPDDLEGIAARVQALDDQLRAKFYPGAGSPAPSEG